MNLSAEIENSIPMQYAYGVRDGKILVGRKIKLSVIRFFKLIDKAEACGYWLDAQKGFAVIRFFENILTHTKGRKHNNKPFILSPFQQFTLFWVFAWQTLNEEGEAVRLIKNVYEKLAKKNGKTAVMAGILLYCLAFDGEPGAEVYIGATIEKQAKLCFDQAAAFVNTSPLLKKLGYRVLRNRIYFDGDENFAQALGGDSKTQDGINSHLSIIDEYHAHRDDSVKENLESSSAARMQAITWTITTAGTEIHGVCKSFEDSCVNLLEEVVEDDTFVVMIHDLDDDDDWNDTSVWHKANPNLGVTVSMRFLELEYLKAKNQPSKAPNFKTKHLNMWVDSPSVWLPSENWDKCRIPIIEDNFAEFGNCGGLDLSTTTDITAYAMISKPDAEGWRDLKVWCFCPKDTIDKHARDDKVPYRYWSELLRENPEHDKDFYLIATPGNMVDYNAVSDLVIDQYYKHKTAWVEYDRKFSGSLITTLQNQDVDLSPFTQTLSNYTAPTKAFEVAVMSNKIRVGNNPILKWMLSGCVPIYDTNENVRLDKSKTKKRIDGIIASIMALAGTQTEVETQESKYNGMKIPEENEQV